MHATNCALFLRKGLIIWSMVFANQRQSVNDEATLRHLIRLVELGSHLIIQHTFQLPVKCQQLYTCGQCA